MSPNEQGQLNELWQMMARCLDNQTRMSNFVDGMTQRATQVLAQCAQTVEGFRADLLGFKASLEELGSKHKEFETRIQEAVTKLFAGLQEDETKFQNEMRQILANTLKDGPDA